MKNAINIFLISLLMAVSGIVNAATPFPFPAGYFVPAKMPMHLVYPRPDTETAAHARHRWAHPQMEYAIPIGVQGGSWPFKYELVSGPSGAKIGSLYGETNYGSITWTPTATSGTQEFKVRITDQELKTVEATWKVTIDPSMFVFVKSGATGTKTGAIDNPLATAAEWHKSATDSTYANKIIVFRGGNYNLVGDIANNNNVRLTANQKTPSLIGFPGEEPVIDASTAKILVGDLTDIFVAGITWKNARNDVADAHFFWLTGEVSRTTFWRNHFTDMQFGKAGTDNTGPVFISNTVKAKTNILYKENLITNVNNATGNGHYFDIYRASYVLVEQNIARNSATSYGFWVKSSISFVSVRANEAFDNVRGTQTSIGYGSAVGEVPHDHEICWNRIVVPSDQDGPAILAVISDFYKGQSYNTFIYRNTVVNGYSTIRFMGKTPFETDANVIVTTKPNLWNTAEMKTTIPNVVAGPTAGIVQQLEGRYVGAEFGKVGADVATSPAPVAPLNPKYQ
ncbi:hypothetical protein [Cellvibrio fibrivorans]|uniref:Pectate lyase n=1 Tax=Cellvibrio fibrivorans TaxID=126350 RepID=A0ABU1UU02_9GAMM|nr:hypothetical protein [Cellvibrio fibrivorans]MDR7088664.1 hypothetical protein [Cellvibrio fibrivorans]